MNSSIKVTLFLCFIVSVAFASSIRLGKYSEDDRRARLIKVLAKQLKTEDKQEVVNFAY